MSEKHYPVFRSKLRWTAVAVSFFVLADSSQVSAQQQTGTAVATQASLQTLKGLLEELQADPENPQVWYKLGQALSTIPGYNAAASVWLEAYLLAVPNAPNATAVRGQIKSLGSVKQSRAESLAAQLEVFALDSRASLYDRQGKTDLAIADFKRILQLNPQQERAKEALKRLEETKRNRTVLVTPTPMPGPDQETSGPTSDKPYYYVADTRPPDAYLSLRTNPSGSYGQRIMEMPNGTVLQVMQRQSDGWWYVRVIPSGEQGWALNRQGDRVWIYCCTSGN